MTVTVHGGECSASTQAGNQPSKCDQFRLGFGIGPNLAKHLVKIEKSKNEGACVEAGEF